MLLGNHRDAWSYGAADALSGQAVMLEIGRALGAMKKKGTPQQSSSCLQIAFTVVLITKSRTTSLYPRPFF